MPEAQFIDTPQPWDKSGIAKTWAVVDGRVVHCVWGGSREQRVEALRKWVADHA